MRILEFRSLYEYAISAFHEKKLFHILVGAFKNNTIQSTPGVMTNVAWRKITDARCVKDIFICAQTYKQNVPSLVELNQETKQLYKRVLRQVFKHKLHKFSDSNPNIHANIAAADAPGHVVTRTSRATMLCPIIQKIIFKLH